LDIGGLVGFNLDTVTQRYSMGLVTSTDNAAGLIGLTKSKEMGWGRRAVWTQVSGIWKLQDKPQVLGASAKSPPKCKLLALFWMLDGIL